MTWSGPSAYRRAMLSKDAQGPRAVMNTLGRIVESYEEERQRAVQDLRLAETQLTDYEAPLGRPFAHAQYMDELTGLRDRLKAALSETPKEGELSPAELTEKIKELRAGHTVEAAPLKRAKPEPRRKPPEQPTTSMTPVSIEPVVETPEIPPHSFREQVGRSRAVQRSLF